MKRIHLALAGIIVSIGLFVLYASMLPVDVTVANNGADGGDFLAAILSDGVPHPSGYPTYLLVGKLFQLLPLDSPYSKQALVSALFAALAAGLLTYQFGIMGQADISPGLLLGSLVCGGVMGIAPLFWSQAVIVEVHGLQSFFMACFLLWTVLVCKSPPVDRSRDMAISILSILIGFAMGNHVTILLSFPAILFALYWGWRNGVGRRNIVKYAVLILSVGIGVYGYLPMLARNHPPVNWGNVQTIPDLFRLVSGQIYQGLLFGISPGEYLQRISAWAGLLMHQFWLPGMLLGVVGAFRFHKSYARLKWVLLWVFAVYSVFSIGYQTNDSYTYLLPMIMVFSIWIGVAVREYWDEADGKLDAGRILAGILIVTFLIRIPLIWSEVDPRKDQTSKHFVESCISSLPREAIVITSADEDTFSLWYYQYGLGYREDIKIVASGLLQFDWYRQNLSHTYPDLKLPDPGWNNLEEAIGRENPELLVCSAQYNFQEGGGTCICNR